MVIAESLPKQLFDEMPVILLDPIDKTQVDETQRTSVYSCPVYKESSRRGVLSTTGHSSNHIMDLDLPIAQDQTSKLWIKRGVALLTQLDD